MTRTGRVGVGFIGAGMISEQYLTNLTTFPDVEVVRIGDIDTARAAESAAKWGVPASGTGEDVLADPDVEIVVNLTLPATHVEVSTAALRAGKHVWSEKPIGVDRESAAGLVALADELGLRLGIAPDTVLGTGWQTAKRAIEAGVIGTPLTAVTSMQWQGPDVFHPNASFLYAKGAGPLFDIGPYYFTALVHLLGPVESVVATGSRSRETRQLVVGPNAGQEFPVEVPTHVSVLTSFEQGGNAQSLLSFDTPLFRHGVFEVNGTEGTIVLPDPNTFGGGHPIRIARPLGKDVSFPFEQDWETLSDEEPTVGRGLGVLDMARAIRGGGSHVATGEVGYHVLDTMVAVEESIARRAFVPVASTVAPIASLPEDFDPLAATLEGAPAAV
ncbi:Gfo/Idh/MocA family oxidoreductase [Curtobacterium sp. C1]|uniref:Gfo/Idh/MocA family protein n=1 Tax=Curtobacterium TaxID=2034 RepID=UPI001E291FE2|nr:MULTISPECIES: Gfo/Idh/MocA family oxidoreductase [Curtobacterium]MCS5487055.1 Gfo/Idh/MocA family oxidoreductase [Curtobacterium flaccumfaciens pv. basellae]MDK8172335.1 Gfo/Idh/MocA family oxidoreductase [Curtobacterium citreum]UFU13534.1 Gfo/Idh/MocA family oxidoreductase [Curtobacterium sp. C1]WIJ44757.1 Gfo/Idh/MocA family oxidoreductase [Curtobacterium citreum]